MRQVEIEAGDCEGRLPLLFVASQPMEKGQLPSYKIGGCPYLLTSDVKPTSLDVGRIVEEYGELNASVSELRESRRLAVPGVEIRSCVVWWKDDQRIQELQDLELIAGR